MLRSRGLGRLALLAVGLGIGAALAAAPGVASADSSTDPFSWIGGMDLGDLSVPAQALDIQVNISGIDLFPTADNTATATASLGNIAIAIGNGAEAQAGPPGGIFDLAFADGTNSAAFAGFGILDTATAVGNSSAAASGVGSLDFATAVGNSSAAVSDVGGLDFATVFGADGTARAGNGYGDIAFILGTDSTATAGDPTTVTPGSFDLAAVFGDMLNAMATGGNFMVDILPML
jgi:hypothetical protein